MNLPTQAVPVKRGYARAHQGQSLTQSCNWLQCTAAVAGCAAVCIPDPFNPGCISCLGPLYGSCHDCF
jgi:hypothetical protein